MKKGNFPLTFTFVLMALFSTSVFGGNFIGFYVNGMNAKYRDAEKQWQEVVNATRSYNYSELKNYKPYLMYSNSKGLLLDSFQIIGFSDILDECYKEGLDESSEQSDKDNCRLYKNLISYFKIFPRYGYKVQTVAFSRGNILVQKAIKEAQKEVYLNEPDFSSFAIGSPIAIEYGWRFTMEEDKVIAGTSMVIPHTEGNIEAEYASFIRQYFPEYEDDIGSYWMNEIFFGEKGRKGHSLIHAYYSPWGIRTILQKTIAENYIRLK